MIQDSIYLDKKMNAVAKYCKCSDFLLSLKEVDINCCTTLSKHKHFKFAFPLFCLDFQFLQICIILLFKQSSKQLHVGETYINVVVFLLIRFTRVIWPECSLLFTMKLGKMNQCSTGRCIKPINNAIYCADILGEIIFLS